MSEASKMPLLSYLTVGIGLAALFVLIQRRLRYENGSWGGYQPRAVTTGASVTEIAFSNLEAEARGQRAMALMCASVCWRGDPTDAEGLLSVADEFLQYIQGDTATMPRPDAPIRGQMPKTNKR